MTPVANPRTHNPCYYQRKRCDFQPWRQEGWVLIKRCEACGSTLTQDMRPKGTRECLYCQKPLPGRKINWCGDEACWKQLSAYRSSTSWSKYIHWRDKETCQDCGVTDIPTEAHHIIPVSEGGIELDPDNGVLLCLDCHDDRHGKRRRNA